ncbi:MAG: hypothetical protein GVY20_02020 [Bacteroidetes bacterium]|jgi:hypothetical protein|nr:hypothetical protein [Bacteroidota bacterium]
MKEYAKIKIGHKMFKEANTYIFKHEGYVCVITRMTFSGTLNGYVAVDETHPLYKKASQDVYAPVHWGLTYAESYLATISDDFFDKPLWWFGFDTNHLHDESPIKMFGFDIDRDETYRDMDFVKNETKKLAEFLKEKES